MYLQQASEQPEHLTLPFFVPDVPSSYHHNLYLISVLALASVQTATTIATAQDDRSVVSMSVMSRTARTLLEGNIEFL